MLDITTDISGPVFDGRAATAMRTGTDAVRHALADEGMRIARGIFTSRIKNNEGVFISTLTQTESSRVYLWSGSWTRDTDMANGGVEHVTRAYSMPITVADPHTDIVVTSSDAMYGPWLEGTGSRNQTTRFKGYHGFRMAAQELEIRAASIADDVLQPYVEECR